jgi:Fe-S-cluster containining protein
VTFVADYEVDYSEVAGRKVDCPEGCGMCCLCQPEVLPEERQFFKASHPRSLVKVRDPEPHTALALKKGCGSCVFLNGRRCDVYEHRTAYCRQFPYHLYASDRLKVELDLSCRGVWTGTGNDALAEAKDLVARASDRIVAALEQSKAVYREFYANCRESGVMSDPSRIRMTVSENASMFTDLAYLSRIMDMVEIEPVMSLSGLQPETRLDLPSLEEAGRELAMDSMSSDDPLNVPVYCDGKWNWNMFMASNGRIRWNVMDDEGDLHEMGSADAGEIALRVPDAEGSKVLSSYVGTLNGRDSFLGNVFSMMDLNEYRDDMANAYYGCLSVSVMDLLWRMSMLDHFMGVGNGAEGMREAVIFYDMDRLDAPTIGAFV